MSMKDNNNERDLQTKIHHKLVLVLCHTTYVLMILMFKGMEHVPNMFMSFIKCLFLEVTTILI